MKNPEADLSPSDPEALGEQIAEDEGCGFKPTYGLNDPSTILETLKHILEMLESTAEDLDHSQKQIQDAVEAIVAQTHG